MSHNISEIKKRGVLRQLRNAAFVTTLVFSLSNPVRAQGNSQKNIQVDVPNTGILSIRGTSGTDVVFALDVPTEAGSSFITNGMRDSSLWLNYTVIKGSSSKPKMDIFVRISTGTLPSGFALKLEARQDNGNGSGNKGTPTGQITLSTSDQKIIENIRTSYTGKGNGKGHRLIYDLEVANMAALDADLDATLEITYTIVD